MKISQITSFLESFAHTSLQEAYDNAGLIIGDYNNECTGILISLDAIEEVIKEAIAKKCNLIVAHHPIIFEGLKKINGKNYIEKTVVEAIRNNIAIYAIHTNLDNVIEGVNGKIATMLGLENVSVLAEKPSTLKKLYTYVPANSVEEVRNAIFSVGAGKIGNYSECSFNTGGIGTFKGEEHANPWVGKIGARHYENEIRVETIFPAWLELKVVNALKEAHPYEEVAYDITSLLNTHKGVGSGLIGYLSKATDEIAFLTRLKTVFQVPVIRHTELTGRIVKKVAICGGAGRFLITNALATEVDFFVTADMKYHDFFDANGRTVIADIGHYESEQFTINLMYEILVQKFPTFAVLKTEVDTNPIHYF